MPVTSQKYVTCYPFVKLSVFGLSIPFDSGLSNLNFPLSSVYFVILTFLIAIDSMFLLT